MLKPTATPELYNAAIAILARAAETKQRDYLVIFAEYYIESTTVEKKDCLKCKKKFLPDTSSFLCNTCAKDNNKKQSYNSEFHSLPEAPRRALKGSSNSQN